jgi:hypothetical protein
VPAVIFRKTRSTRHLARHPRWPGVFTTGIRGPAGSGAGAYALRRELGEATANAMLDHPGGDTPGPSLKAGRLDARAWTTGHGSKALFDATTRGCLYVFRQAKRGVLGS